MSLISNRHNVNLFISGKSAALTGQRLSKVGYKNTEKAGAKYPSICVSVPQIPDSDIQDHVSRLIPYIKDLLGNVQDNIIRSLYESSEGKLSSISDSEISVSACINYLESESTGGRLSKEYVEFWFDTNMSEALTVLIADKLGFDLSTPDQEKKVSDSVKIYKELISSLTGNKTILTPEQIKACKRAIEICEIDDDVSRKLGEKLIKMSEKKTMSELLEL